MMTRSSSLACASAGGLLDASEVLAALDLLMHGEGRCAAAVVLAPGSSSCDRMLLGGGEMRLDLLVRVNCGGWCWW
jgi:hypothetical protein